MSFSCAVCSRSFSRSQELRGELLSLEELGEVKFNDDGVALEGDRLVEFLKGFDSAIIGLEKIDYDVLRQLPGLKLISKYGVGLDNINVSACEISNVSLAHTGGVNRQAVAELALAYMILGARFVFKSNQDVVNKRVWNQVIGRELSEICVGIVGFGNVGSKLFDLCKGLVKDVKFFDIDPLAGGPRSAHRLGSLDEILNWSDVISIHVPHNEDNHLLFGAREFKLMKKGCFLINTARKNLVCEKSLARYIKGGELSGCALDVLGSEPIVESPVIGLPNVFVSSHIGGSSRAAVLAMGRAAIEGVKKFLS